MGSIEGEESPRWRTRRAYCLQESQVPEMGDETLSSTSVFQFLPSRNLLNGDQIGHFVLFIGQYRKPSEHYL